MKNIIVHTAVKSYLTVGKMLANFNKFKNLFKAETVEVNFRMKGNRMVYTYHKVA